MKYACSLVLIFAGCAPGYAAVNGSGEGAVTGAGVPREREVFVSTSWANLVIIGGAHLAKPDIARWYVRDDGVVFNTNQELVYVTGMDFGGFQSGVARKCMIVSMDTPRLPVKATTGPSWPGWSATRAITSYARPRGAKHRAEWSLPADRGCSWAACRWSAPPRCSFTAPRAKISSQSWSAGRSSPFNTTYSVIPRN